MIEHSRHWAQSRRRMAPFLFVILAVPAHAQIDPISPQPPAGEGDPPPVNLSILNENCTVSVLSRTMTVGPNGEFELPNIPAQPSAARAKVVCQSQGETLGGLSEFFLLENNSTVSLGTIRLSPIPPVVQSLLVESDTDVLTEAGATVQMTVTGIFANGETIDLTLPSAGTIYISSNPAILEIVGEGQARAGQASGAAFVNVIYDGVIASRLFTVRLQGDRDQDSLPDDFEEAFPCLDPDLADAGGDPDADGMTSRQEFQTGTDPCIADTDGDGLKDGQEAAVGSNPVLPDSDLDGLLDGQEPNPTGDGDSDGLINILDPDQDNDGLPDGIEARICGSPTCANPTADNDGDGLSNLDEVELGTDPTRADTDGDGLSDSAEVLGGTDPVNPDMDGDGFPDGFETAIGSDPRDASSIPVIPSATEAVGKPFSVLSIASPAPPASLEAAGRIVSVLNRATPAPPAFAEADGKVFSLLNQATPAPPTFAEADGKVFSLLNTALPPAPSPAEAIGKIFSMLNGAGPASPASAEAVSPLVSVENTTPP